MTVAELWEAPLVRLEQGDDQSDGAGAGVGVGVGGSVRAGLPLPGGRGEAGGRGG